MDAGAERLHLNAYMKELIGPPKLGVKNIPSVALENPVSIEEVLEKGQTGDVVVFRGRGFTSTMIEAVEGAFSHSAILFRGTFTRTNADGSKEIHGEEGELQILQVDEGREYPVKIVFDNGKDQLTQNKGVILARFQDVYEELFLKKGGEVGCWLRLRNDDVEARRTMAENIGIFAGKVAHAEYDSGIVHMSLISCIKGLLNTPANVKREKYYCSSLVAACLMNGGILPMETGGEDGHSVLNYTPGKLSDPKEMNARTVNGFKFDEPRLMQRNVDLNDPAIQEEPAIKNPGK